MMRRQRWTLSARERTGTRCAGSQGAWRRSLAATAAAALLPLIAGCATEEAWSFPVSSALSDWVDLDSGAAGGDPAGDCGAVFFLAVPLALDLLVLPITLPRDLIERGSPW